MLDTKELKYFVTVADHGSITKAANILHLTQPTITRTIQNLEDRLGFMLFKRKSHSLQITQQGLLFKQRAQEILDLVAKTEHEFILSNKNIVGTVSIGCAETVAFNYISHAMKNILQKGYKIDFNIVSNNAQDVINKLEAGLVDFGLIIDPIGLNRFCYLEFDYTDKWCVLLHKQDKLSNKSFITKEDLLDSKLIVSKQLLDTLEPNHSFAWLLEPNYRNNIVATYNLLFNAIFLAEQNIAKVLCLDNIVSIKDHINLVSIPYKPIVKAKLYLIYKKEHILLNAQRLFLETISKLINEDNICNECDNR